MRNTRRTNRLRVQPWEGGQDWDGIMPGLDAMREADGADLVEQPDVTAESQPVEEVNALVRQQSILSDAELQALLARAENGEWDDFDFLTLCEHVQAKKAEADELIQRTHAANQQAQIAMLHKEEALHAARVALGKLQSTVAYWLSLANGKVVTPLEALEEVAREAHRATKVTE